ncbi:HAMP domain-containing methyl-accepting chemotaxis protein [Rhizobium sp. DKSPLA3]|uniref:HAMP domain-containing methyl-accepting chemotaxis protein n=1 Tax=Rhizobium quercicola TaxID=2901226 RepID=A0A9X1NVI6_9HYPH|nr:HAMP domain-containing methyl-accepting chemotaxis protein [Rhizobium quercicola]MCD7111170.1 HAMP domain-containing methyl-accepting chemotaxis protein [Rhizobium quercicola]
MSFFQNAKVGTKLMITSGISILLVVGIISNQMISDAKTAEANAILEREQIVLDGVVNAKLALSNMRFASRGLRLVTSEAETQKATTDVRAYYDNGMAGMQKPIQVAPERDTLKQIAARLTDYETISEKRSVDVLAAFQKVGGRKLTLEEMAAAVANTAADNTKVAETASKLINDAVKDATEITADAKASLKDMVAQARTVSLAINSAIILILIASAAVLVRSVGRPIRVMTQAMRQLAAGQTDIDPGNTDRKDEIGDMAGAVEVFRQSAISNKRLEQEAEAARAHAEAERTRLTAEAEAAARERMQQATSGLATGLRRLASGDLGFQLDQAFAPDFEALRHDLNGAIGQLSATLLSVAQATTQIDTGTREISQSADDLSRRTEQQAASLEETAAALDEITANVTNSSKRAEEARSIAVQANASAGQSGKVVADAVDAMQKIEQSSDQVANIIGVIDEIAFQTNLLALNAGVEAARAGEAGKGFAVVAQEVRELAQRSAKAAKEIKDLIRNSSVEVQSGVKLVSQTGEALKTIEDYIVTINQHMDAIATSAREQSVGLSEVNTAVNQMDQVTQQNAAMVEESNAASAALAGEAERLRDLISRFQFGDANRASARTTPPVAAANATHRPAASPARKMTAQIARSFSGNAAVQQTWEDF